MPQQRVETDVRRLRGLPDEAGYLSILIVQANLGHVAEGESSMKVYFVGAGPGDPELLTVKARRLLESARLCIYAGSLVNPALLDLLPAEAERYDSAAMNLDEIVERFQAARERQIDVVRLHTGEPAIYGAIGEQMDALDRLQIDYEVVPGISAFQAAAATLQGGTDGPRRRPDDHSHPHAGPHADAALRGPSRLAQSRATLCIFLSTDRIAELAGMLAEPLRAGLPGGAGVSCLVARREGHPRHARRHWRADPGGRDHPDGHFSCGLRPGNGPRACSPSFTTRHSATGIAKEHA